MIVVPSTAPSARNRFIWYKSQLNKLPSSLPAFLLAAVRLPVIRSLISTALVGLLREPFRASRFQRPKSESKSEVERQRSREYLLDESIESFIRRRFGDAFGGRLVNNVLSAVIHGIYAADVGRLSVRSALPMLWNTEQKHGSLLRAFLPPKWNKRYRAPTSEQRQMADAEKQELETSRRVVKSLGGDVAALDGASVFSFKDGIGELTTAISRELQQRHAHNVLVRLGEATQSVAVGDSDTDGIMVTTDRAQVIKASRVISALPSATLSAMLSAQQPPLPSILTHNPSTNVTVVNVAIPASALSSSSSQSSPPRSRRIVAADEGFGFLIPRAENDANPDGILGVVFDSDAVPGQDGDGDGDVTKLTVMIGGPHYKGTPAVMPSHDDARQRAVRALERHLGVPRSITEHPHTLVRVRTQRDCIPTYLPGHYSRMRTLHDVLASGKVLNGRLSVTGASYLGVSLNDIVRSGMRLGEAIAEAEKKDGEAVVTGLEAFRL